VAQHSGRTTLSASKSKSANFRICDEWKVSTVESAIVFADTISPAVPSSFVRAPSPKYSPEFTSVVMLLCSGLTHVVQHNIIWLLHGAVGVASASS
jgi:hypothetical protein